ncbi:MAG: hypothetical protein C0600_09285 [Ignavibacteria bacterium]|nr:MAG: hypothetical protein C0600_09285 [Ignavibacteria bacterium]
MKHFIVLLLLLVVSSAQAQTYSREALRLGLNAGVNIGGEEATIKYASYTAHPIGIFSVEYYAVDRLALTGSLYAGTLSAELSGRTLFPAFGRQPISAYDTKYYGTSLGINYAFPDLWKITPIGRLRLGGLMHHTRVNGEGGFEVRTSQGAMIYSLGGALEFPASHDIALNLAFDVVLTDSDELDGLRSGQANDALVVITLGMNILLQPGYVPPPRARAYAAQDDRSPSPAVQRTERINIAESRRQDERTTSREEPSEAADDEVDRSGDTEGVDESGEDWDDRRDGKGVTGSPDDDGSRDRGLVLNPTPPSEEALRPTVDENAPLQLFTQLSLVPVRRFTELEKNPDLFTLKVWQTGDDEMMLKSYVEILRDGRNIYQGNADLRLDGPLDEFRADEFLDLEELLLRNQGDALLPRGNYVVRVSTVEWDHELSSLSQGKFLNVDLRPIFGQRANDAREVIVQRATDVMAEGDEELMVNFFAAGARAAEREQLTQKELRRVRESLALAPIGTVGATRDRLLSSDVLKSFTEALQLQNIASASGHAEHLKVVVSELYFPIDGDQLNEESRIILDNVARQLNQHPELFAEIRGYANDMADETYNETLARRRADRVLEYLVRQKMNAYRLSSTDVRTDTGMSAPNQDPRLGRKVEIILRSKGM